MWAAEVLVAHAADVVERLLAVAVAAAAVGSIGAEGVLAVGSSETSGTRAFSVRADAVVALFSVALEWGGTGATAAATVASHPRRQVWVHALRRSRHQEEEEEKDRCEHCVLVLYSSVVQAGGRFLMLCFSFI